MKAPWGGRSAPSTLEWAALALGLVLVFQYRWILDDSTIYFRYVDNLLFLDRGAVFNPGEYVEGYSSPLWFLVLTALRATQLDFWTLTLLFGLAAWTAFWFAAVRVHRTLQGEGAGPTIDLPILYLATTYGVMSYFTSGSESALVQLAAVAVALYAAWPDRRIFQVLVGLLPLVRNELVLPMVVAGLAGGWVTRRVPWALVASAAAFGGGWLAFRVVYYADLFPNTFYLKDAFQLGRGVYYLRNTYEPYNLAALGVGVLMAVVTLRRRSDGSLALRRRSIMVASALSAVPYVVKVGGDMMHYRLLAFPFCLLVLSTGGLLERWLSALEVAASARARIVVGAAIAIAAFASFPRFLSSHPLLRRDDRELDRGISDAPWHRDHDKLSYGGRAAEDRARLDAYFAEATPDRTSRVESDILCAAMFQGFTTSWVHAYGLTEPFLARLEVADNRPGHKEDLRTLAPDVVALRSEFGGVRGAVDRAVAAGRAAPWIVHDADKLRMVEAKMYNAHDLVENLGLAFRRVGPLAPP